MTIHKSLVTRGKLAQHRNVLTRAERIQRLQEEERWKQGESIFGLPKVRNIKMKARKKAKKVVAEGAEAVEGAAPAEGAPPTPEAGDKKSP